MDADCSIAANIKRAQMTMFDEAARRGITHKIIYYDSGRTVSLSAIGQYARGETIMGLAVVNRLAKIIPADLLSLLLVDDDLHIVKAPAELDHDEYARLALELAAEHARARHPQSPGGVEIAPCEDKALKAKVMHLVARAA